MPSLNNIQLSEDKKQILKDFIVTFLPPRNNKRKNSGNELFFVHRTLDKLFIQNFDFNISERNVVDAFIELDYTIFAMKGKLDIDSKDIKSFKAGDVFSNTSVYADYEASFIYIDISADTMRYLSKTTSKLSDDTKLEKLEKINLFKDHIKNFKSSINISK